jgi:hypothetical protein
LGRKLLDKERHVSWNILMVNTNRWTKVQAFFYIQLQVTASAFSYNKPDRLFGLVE